MTSAERTIWNKILKNRKFKGLRWLRQRPIDNFIVDFYCAKLKLVIEIDGSSHENKREADKEREEILKSHGLHIIRFTNDEVEKNLGKVYQKLARALS